MEFYGQHRTKTFKLVHSYLYENLNEGLIKSYDIANVKKYLNNEMNFNCINNVYVLDRNIYTSKYKEKSDNEFVRISLKTDFKSLSRYNDVVNVCYRLLGWFVGIITVSVRTADGFKEYAFFRNKPKVCDNTVRDTFYSESSRYELANFVSLYSMGIVGFDLYIEEKFPIKEYVYDDNEVFYHLTDRRFIRRIMQHGLVPRSRFNYPSRIYLTNSIDYLDDVELDIKEPVLLKITLKRHQKLYKDPRCYGVFTYENISPDEIEILDFDENDIHK